MCTNGLRVGKARTRGPTVAAEDGCDRSCNGTDAADAQVIWTAARRSGVRFVAIKSEVQQVVLALHRVRAQLMKMRIMQTNELGGLLYEFGIVLHEGH